MNIRKLWLPGSFVVLMLFCVPAYAADDGPIELPRCEVTSDGGWHCEDQL
ncbi:MAG: hypothetical protein PF630_01900 [Gammaproteobacteria bacterium]|jgi:hypothetical protein|nr:hypothetical protein [Gammaproteobacteria bacterium]